MPQLPLEEQIEKKKAEIRQLENRLRKKNGRMSAETRQKRNKFITVVGYGATKLLSKNPTLKNDVLSVLDKKDRDFFTANYDLLVDGTRGDYCELCAKHKLTTETIVGLGDEMEGRTYSSAKELIRDALNA